MPTKTLPKPKSLPWTVDATHASRNVATVRIEAAGAGETFHFLLRSDVHHDNPKCDQRTERRHLDEAVQRRAGIIDNGDLFCAMQGKYDKRADKNSLRAEHRGSNYLDQLVNTAAEFYKPYAHHILTLGRGNHETAILKNHETDLTDRLGTLLKVVNPKIQVGGYGGWVRFMFTIRGALRCSKLLHYYHGTGGGGPVTRGVIQTNRMAVFNPDPDIILTGHTHDQWVVPIARQRLSDLGVPYHDRQIHVRVPGYKDAWGDGYAGWEVERALGPKPKGSAWLTFTTRRQGVDVEVREAM